MINNKEYTFSGMLTNDGLDLFNQIKEQAYSVFRQHPITKWLATQFDLSEASLFMDGNYIERVEIPIDNGRLVVVKYAPKATIKVIDRWEISSDEKR